MNLNEQYPEKIVSAETAVKNIKKGSRVFLGTGCGEPQHLIRTMVKDRNLQDIMLYQMLGWTLAEFVDNPDFLERFMIRLFFVSARMRAAAYEGKIDYVPSYLSQIPRLFANKSIGLDVALVQVSPPDQFGYCSLGVSVDITKSAMENARLVIAQVNSGMPRTWGDSFIHVEDIDYLVLKEEPLVMMPDFPRDPEVSRRIGQYVSSLVQDGATLQIGFGRLPGSILRYLDKKKDLGLHTQVITDDMLPLFEKGIINNRKKSFLPGRAVASLCMGSEMIYHYVHDNPMFYFRSSSFVNDPVEIARNDNLISISSALEVDLTGQVCSDSVGYQFYSGIGDQVDFLRGSAMSKGGFSIIALPSTAHGGKVSRIVPHLTEGAGVATTRADPYFIVTEYGIADLQGKGIYQRVIELAQIAHPKFREELIEVAKERRYIFVDQLPPSEDDLQFLEAYKESKELRNGQTIEFRPLLSSDEFDCRNFFYSLQEQTIYRRFFYKMQIFSHEVIQRQYANVDYRKNMSMLALAHIGSHKEIVAIGSYGEYTKDQAEVAFIVREDYQSMGIASHLLAMLERIAKENDYKRFYASTLGDNVAMLHVFEKRYPNAEISKNTGGEVTILMDFEDAVEKNGDRK